MSSCNPAVPTLKQMSLVVIAVKISNDPEIKAYDGFPFKMIRFRANGVPESTNDPTSKMWEEIVSKNISCLGLLPNNLKSELRSFVHLICLEIDEWQTDHKVCPFPSEVLQRCLRWNPQGKIDRLKSVNTLLNEKGQCQSTCFVLAHEWQKDHKVCPFPSKVLQRCLRWNPQGKINWLKSVKILLNEKGQCQSSCFALARKYGLVSYANTIWKKMDSVEREIYLISRFNSQLDSLRRQWEALRKLRLELFRL
ncbi:hypothetical protein TNIN_398531 [Trichonephila inaurata madagascariensis]|uniref:Uncharacterized protein n=1 Tax=Trichonephila inaurata madagascariensis TaxID=2747483 RepID=A0A8X6K7A2_9ARAC|nr:hypothetical protein TNIN_398531 [Trichonephila inaurata madagascariensis]